MSLGAIDFGLIIDGAVVIVENVVRQLGAKQHQLGRRLTTDERLHTVMAASKQVGTPMFFGVVIIAVVYLPILALSGIEGKMFHPMALTVMLALAGSLVLALTLMPALCSFLLGGRIAERDNLIVRLIKSAYSPTLRSSLRLRWVVVLGAIALFALAIFIFRHLGANFIPKLDEGTFTMMVFRGSSISIEKASNSNRTDREIPERVPEVTHVFSRIGSAEIATDPMPPSDTDFYIYYKPRENGERSNRLITKDELAEIISKELEALNPGAHIMVAQPVEMRFNEMLEGIRADIAVKIFGNDYDVLESLGAEVKELLEQTARARRGRSQFETTGRSPSCRFDVKRDVLAKIRLHAGEVNKTIPAAFGGRSPYMVKRECGSDRGPAAGADRERKRFAQKKIASPRGAAASLPLGELVDIRRVKTVSPILHDSGQRRAALMVNLRGRDVEGLCAKQTRKCASRSNCRKNYIVELGGQFQTGAAFTRLAVVMPRRLCSSSS